MAFTNVAVAPTKLPAFEEVDCQTPDPGYAWLVFWITALVASIMGIALVVVMLLVPLPPHLNAPASFVTLLLLVLFAAWPWYQFKAARAVGYAVRDHDLILQSGLFWRRERIQPIRRVRHVELTRGPLEKRIGLSNIKLFSAGTGRAIFTIPGLKLITAARIPRYVLQSIQY